MNELDNENLSVENQNIEATEMDEVETETSETIETTDENETVTFEDLGLDEYALKAVEKKGFVTPLNKESFAKKCTCFGTTAININGSSHFV